MRFRASGYPTHPAPASRNDRSTWRFKAAARTAVRVDPRTMIAVGLLVAIASGAIALLDREPVLTAQWDTVHVFGLPEFTVGTPLLFDLGVFIVVLGVTLTIILALAEE